MHVPLNSGDSGAVVSFKEILDTLYQRARYDESIDYDALLESQLNEAEFQLIEPQAGRDLPSLQTLTQVQLSQTSI